MARYLALTESALDLMLMHDLIGADGLPKEDTQVALAGSKISEHVYAYYTSQESGSPYFALVNRDALSTLVADEEAVCLDIYRRIARVVKGLKSPPIHLPRQWSEYHHRNLLTFFALPKSASTYRWIADTDGAARCVRFEALSSRQAQVTLADFSAPPWPRDFGDVVAKMGGVKAPPAAGSAALGLAAEIDLTAIGSGSVVRNRTYEEWHSLLSDSQKSVLSHPVNASIRIVGPAGSGKTLALCLRAVQIARDPDVQSQGKKVLIATHSWAMAERIDGVLTTLNSGTLPEGVTVFPLLSLLQMHAGHIGQQRTDVIGDDSTDGRVRAIEIIKAVLAGGRPKREGLSKWIADGLSSAEDSRARLDLLFNLYEEIAGVLTASSVALDDPESVRSYLNGPREDWMPPFITVADRGLVLGVYREFIRVLIDRSAITTDQFVLDSIRVLETFTWRMRKETDGYDYILVDELQLFDSQERSALELLGRSRQGVPFVTAEDPSQGVFATLHSRREVVANQTVYLETVHRFDKEIFDLISFIYQKFPLNTVPLRIDVGKTHGSGAPKLYLADSDEAALQLSAEMAATLFRSAGQDDRICLATVGDVDADICAALDTQRLGYTRLMSFDDVEQLSYSKRSIIVAPWQFIGGTQFSHVIVVAVGVSPATTAFGKRHELTAMYLACSRSTRSLSIICSGYVPQVIRDAKEQGLVLQEST